MLWSFKKIDAIKIMDNNVIKYGINSFKNLFIRKILDNEITVCDTLKFIFALQFNSTSLVFSAVSDSYDKIVTKRLTLRHSFQYSVEQLSNRAPRHRFSLWPYRISLAITGCSDAWPFCPCLNRLRTAVRRCTANLQEWWYTTNDDPI